MIVLPDGPALVVFTQEAHAHLAGELAARLHPGDWDRSALVAAARVHDNGWREADQTPTLDRAGDPHTFYRVPPDVYTAVWRRGIARAAGVDPLVGLLVGLHGTRFFGANPHAQVKALHAEERARQGQVLVELGLGTSWQALPAPIQAASDWIAFVDQLSLMVCGELADRTSSTVVGIDYRATREGAAISVDPWPFTDAGGPVSIEGRRLPAHSFPSTESLCAAMADAPIVTRVSTLTSHDGQATPPTAS